MWNLDRLQWQWDWQQGPRLKNLRILVCPDCYDKPQENGRTIVLPPDPIPIKNARPENYALADNPLSPLGRSLLDSFQTAVSSLGANIGNMTLGGGLDAAFNGAINVRSPGCASLSISVSSFQNTVGKNWNAFPSGINLTTPSTVAVVTHNVSSFTLYAPTDMPFLNSGATGIHLDGSADGVVWTTLFSGTSSGSAGEVFTATSSSTGFYQYHRIAIQGDGISQVAVAEVQFNVSDAGANDI